MSLNAFSFLFFEKWHSNRKSGESYTDDAEVHSGYYVGIFVAQPFPIYYYWDPLTLQQNDDSPVRTVLFIFCIVFCWYHMDILSLLVRSKESSSSSGGDSSHIFCDANSQVLQQMLRVGIFTILSSSNHCTIHDGRLCEWCQYFYQK